MKNMNILWICSDQQRWDTLGCYGNRFVNTPILDSLANQGTLFDSCYSQSPVCTPSRASFLTGRYPRTTKCRQNGQNIPKDEVLITKIFADNGYKCGLAGKLHISACHPSVCDNTERRIDDGYSVFDWAHNQNRYLASLAKRGIKHKQVPWEKCKWVNMGIPEEHHQTTWCCDRAISFIKDRHKDDRPWFFSVNMHDPHHPFDPPEKYINRYLNFLDEIPLPNFIPGELTHKSSYQKIDHVGAYGHTRGYTYDELSDKDHRLIKASYWAMCDLIDSQIGRIVGFLEKTDQLDRTIIVFTSDHGEMLGDHGIYLKGPYFYDPAVRVPLIVSCPGYPKAQRSSALVELVDLAPTLLDLVGIDAHPGMQGRSFKRNLGGHGDINRHREDIYCEYYNAMPFHKNPTAQTTMVRTKKHKLTLDHNESSGELYDLEADPEETYNIWENPKKEKIRTEMLMRLCNRMAWTVDPLPKRLAPA